MAAIAVPLIEGAALALLRALGVVAVAGTGAVAINEAAKKKADAADKSKSTPIAKAGAQSKTRDACSKCPPDCGTLVPRDWNMSEISRSYQARITGFAPRTEWAFQNTDFDGFRSQACVLMEAKAKYDQFFNSRTEAKFFFTIVGAAKMRVQAVRQSGVADASPPAQLHWHFMEPLSHAYFTSLFNRAFLNIVTFLTP